MEQELLEHCIRAIQLSADIIYIDFSKRPFRVTGCVSVSREGALVTLVPEALILRIQHDIKAQQG